MKKRKEFDKLTRKRLNWSFGLCLGGTLVFILGVILIALKLAIRYSLSVAILGVLILSIGEFLIFKVRSDFRAEAITKRNAQPREVFQIWLEDNRAFNYGNALQWQKEQYLTYLLYLGITEKTGLNGFFDMLRLEPYEDDEILRIMKRPEIPSQIAKVIKKNLKLFRDESFRLDEAESDILVKYDILIEDLAKDEALDMARYTQNI